MALDDPSDLAKRLKQLVDETGALEQAIETLAAERGVPKRTAEALACDLDLLPRRYDRNAGTLGCKGQKRLLEAHVLVAGLGGLGGYVVEELARCGVGILAGVDADHFDETNLNRQLYADRSSIGLPKTGVAGKRVAAVNEAVEFHPYRCAVEDLPETAYGNVDLIFDCLDRIASKVHLQDVGERLDIPLIHGAIGGWYGQVAVVWPGSRILTRLYAGMKEGIEKELGNPPFTPAVVASLMVTEGVKVLLEKKPRENTVLFVDLLNNQWEQIPF
jgi:molybdopterin/thiamine biosynthesis adenylyltransferase